MTEKTVAEKLREIAGWIEAGREIEFKSKFAPFGWLPVVDVETIDWRGNYEYRIKPDKPHTTHITFDSVTKSGCYIQMTLEVIEALKAAGIDYD